MRIIIAGGREFDDYTKLKEYCNHSFQKIDKSTIEIVSGTAGGADTLGERYAGDNGLTIKRFPANWDKYKKGAGYRRNAEMAEYAQSLIAFWDGKSRGTMHMINIAKKKGLQVRVVEYTPTVKPNRNNITGI
jgi:hypothetical protein